jgi:hypothetical protein
MENISHRVERLEPFTNVLLVTPSDQLKESISEILIDRGINIIGPTTSAARALLLAAQTSVDLAFIESELEAPADGEALAQRLKDDWGVPSVLLAAQRTA